MTQLWHYLRRLARRLLIATLIVAGALCGVVAVVFHYVVQLAQSLLIEPALRQHTFTRAALVIAVPAIVAAILAVIVKNFAPITPGANLARVRRAYLQEPEVLDSRSVFFTFILTPLSLGSGVPLGPETPTVVVTSGVCTGFARLLNLPRKVVRGMIPVGTAAGIAAIFRTPITGVVFAVEEILGTTSRGVLGGTIIAAVAAAVVEHLLLGSQRLLPASAAKWTHVSELLGFLAVGVAAGILGGSVIRIISFLRPWLQQRIPSIVLRSVLGGASAGLLGLMAPSILGVGYPTTSYFLRGGGTLPFASLAFGAKALGFVLAMSAGLLGGTFAPSLFIGAALGAAIGDGARMVLGPSIDPGAYALVGMGSYFGGYLRCPMAAVLIVLELTNDYDLILPLMLGIAVSTAISTRIARQTLTEQQMVAEGYRESREEADPLGRLTVGEIMIGDVQTFPADTPIAHVVERTSERRHRLYPIVSTDGALVGLLAANAIIRTVREGKLDVTAGELMENARVVARTDEPLHDVVARMGMEKMDRCPVIAADGTKRVVGFLSPADLIRARFRVQEADSGESSDITLF
jgi:CIC family chloride channel protein